MATLTYADGRSTLVGGPGDTSGLPGVTVFHRRMDMSELNAVLTTSDVVPLFTMPAGSTVLASAVNVVTAAATTTGVLQVGDSVDPNGIHDGADPNTTGWDFGTIAAATYASDTQINLSVLTADLADATGVFDISVTVAVG